MADEKHESPKGIENVDYINVPKWVKNGGMLTNRDCLSWSDPDHTYNVVKKMLQDARDRGDGGVDSDGRTLRPEDFGVKNPKAAAFEDYSRNELIDEIVELRELVNSYEFHQFPMKAGKGW